MKTKLTIVLAVLFALSTPFAAMAMSHEKGEKKMHEMHEKMEQKGHDDHGMKKGHEKHDDHKSQGKHKGHEHSKHGGMEMEGDMIMLGDDSDDGVKAMAHLKDVKEAMAEMGMPGTHHIMVMFMDKKTGEPIEEGIAARPS